MESTCPSCGKVLRFDDPESSDKGPTGLRSADGDLTPEERRLIESIHRRLRKLAETILCEKCYRERLQVRTRMDRSPSIAHQLSTLAAVVPPEFQSTDLNHGKMKTNEALKALAWTWGPKGLLLAGASGEGKSRCAYEIAKREHLKGRTVIQMTAVRFNLELKHATPTWYDIVRGCDLLLIDDLGKASLGYASQDATQGTAVLFDVIDDRGRHYLPTIITTQLTSREIIEKLGENGVALHRRLVTFCDVILFKR